MTEPHSPHVAGRLAAIEQEYADLEARLADSDVASNPAELRTVSMRYHQLTPLVTAAKRQRALLADADAARELLVHAGDDDRGPARGGPRHDDTPRSTRSPRSWRS